MRHGAAEDFAATGRDADRALTSAGGETVRRVALALRGSHPRPIGRIIASPLVRAQQTAEIVRSVLCPGVDIAVDEDLSPDESAYGLAVRLASAACDTLLVGHQPNIEMVARAIVAPCVPGGAAGGLAAPFTPVPGVAGRMPSSFRTATVVGFHVEGRPPPYRLVLSVDPSAVQEG